MLHMCECVSASVVQVLEWESASGSVSDCASVSACARVGECESD